MSSPFVAPGDRRAATILVRHALPSVLFVALLAFLCATASSGCCACARKSSLRGTDAPAGIEPNAPEGDADDESEGGGGAAPGVASPEAPSATASLPARTALDQYLEAEDDVYDWKVAQRVKGEGYEIVFIDMTSQSWLSPREVDRTEWKHWLIVVRPEKAQSNSAFLFIGGGSNRKGMPKGPDKVAVEVARATGTVVAELRTVPNQPLEFGHDGEERSEDNLIAYAWKRFIETGDDRWLPRFPMVKSAVRAMDTIQAFFAKEDAAHPIEKFVVAGGSKRGWTTWLTGLDRRVSAIVPIVIDILNMQKSMDHHFAAYGFWAPAIGDYERHGIPKWSDHPNWKRLMALVDPYSYRHRLTLPKYIVNASSDQFFLPDSSRFYFADLEGEKHLRYVPNADHSLEGSDALESVAAFYLAVITGTPRPEMDWSFEDDGSIRVRADREPLGARVWSATNPEARDFRLETIGRTWTSNELTPETDGSFVARVPRPERGFTAFFVELRFAGVRDELPFVFTTSVRVVPDELPYLDRLKAYREKARSEGGRG